MLVLTRKIGEQIVIADTIRVSVIEVGPGRVKIGIDAPREITIDRAEIHEKKHIEPIGHFVEVPDLHNRIAEQLLAHESVRPVEADVSAPLRFENRLKKHQTRLPRKPR